MDHPELSVVIPAYNEAAVIRRTVEEVSAFLTRSEVAHELLIVDDGSTDETVELVRALAAEMPSLRLLSSGHRGKGAAVKRGMLDARGAHRLFMDADHSTRIEEWRKCAPWLREGVGVVIGSRKMPGAEVTVHQPPLRETMGKVFTWLTNTALSTRLTDITCGFKAFEARAAEEIFRLQRMDGWGFDAEVLFIARRLGYRVREVPVVWADDASTKVRLVADSFRSIKELAEIRFGAWRGLYGSCSHRGLGYFSQSVDGGEKWACPSCGTPRSLTHAQDTHLSEEQDAASR